MTGSGEQRPPVHWPTFHRDSCGNTIGLPQSDIAALVTCPVCLSQAELHTSLDYETVESPWPLPQSHRVRRDPDGLPAGGSRVVDKDGDIWTQGADGLWRMVEDGRPGSTWDTVEEFCGPLRLI